MYQPSFQYTDKLVNLLIKAESLKTSIHSNDFSYNVKSMLQRNAKILDIFFLSNMMKLNLDLKASEKIVNGVLPSGLTKDKIALLVNYRNCIEFNQSSVAETYMEFDINTILHLNKLVLTSWRESWDIKFRSQEVKDNSLLDDWREFTDQRISGDQIFEEISNLFEWYSSVNASCPNLIKVGIIVYRLIEIYPFVEENKLTILAFLDFLLFKYGYSYKVYSSVLRCIQSSPEKIKKGIYYAKVNASLEFWLEIFIDCIVNELMEVKTQIQEFILEEDKSRKKPFLNLNKRQMKVLQYLQNVPSIKREDYCHMMDVSTMTAFRDLNDLVRKKLLKTVGVGRGTKYKLYSM